MKKFIPALILLSSVSAIAQETKTLKIENVSYPDRTIEIRCKSADCEEMSFKRLEGSKKEDKGVIYKEMLEEMSSNTSRISYSKLRPYELTSRAIKNSKRNFKEGYSGSGMMNALLTIPAAAVDTALFPFDGFMHLVDSYPSYNTSQRRGARSIMANLDSDLQVVKVKHKYYLQIQEALSYANAIFPADSSKVQEFIARGLEGKDPNCTLKVIGTNTYNLQFRSAPNSVSAHELTSDHQAAIYLSSLSTGICPNL